MNTINLEGIKIVGPLALYFQKNKKDLRIKSPILEAFKKKISPSPRYWEVDLYRKILWDFIKERKSLESILLEVDPSEDSFIFLIKSFYPKARVDENGEIIKEEKKLRRIIKSRNRGLKKYDKFFVKYNLHGGLEYIKRGGIIVFSREEQLSLF